MALSIIGKGVIISIHAPVKGATQMSVPSGMCHGYFNPRTREGCDPIRLDAFSTHGLISIHAPVKGAT